MSAFLGKDQAEKTGRLGIPGVTIVAGGFRQVLAGGEALNERLQRTASQYDMVVIGPNTLGFSTFHHGLHGIFWHMDAIPGPVAIISQSGGVGLTMDYSLRGLQCGVSHFIGVGNRTVVDFPDYLGVLRDDPHAGTFLLFIEGVEDPRSLYEAIKKTALKKPVVVYKAGKNEVVSKATATHTGSLAGEYGLYKAMFKQAGAFEADSSWDAAVAAKALSMVRPPRGASSVRPHLHGRSLYRGHGQIGGKRLGAAGSPAGSKVKNYGHHRGEDARRDPEPRGSHGHRDED